jgi:hypothetical protein
VRGTLTTAALSALAFACIAAPASAAPVLVLKGERVVKQQQRFAGSTNLPAPARTAAPKRLQRVRAAGPRAKRGTATREALAGLLRSGQIDQPTHDARLKTLKRALRTSRRLTGARRLELRAVIDNTDAMAAAGALIPSRLAAVFETVERNRQWWTTGPLLSYGRRVSFSGSELIWQYYTGQGIQLQMLANFGKANALWSDRDDGALRQLVDELAALVADRGGYPAFEYYFRFGGGEPPWTSGLSQGTAVQSLARASRRLGDPALSDLAARALAAFEKAPPDGVRDETGNGAFYLIYSFAPDLRVLNGHLQAVIGLYDFARITGDPRAQALYAAGEAEARAVLPEYDTGKWSLYSEERESDLGYHRLVTTFLGNLCRRIDDPFYCDAAARFEEYEDVPPAVTARTSRIRSGRPARLRFTLDKISRVGVTVTDRSGDTVFSTSAVVGRGSRHFDWSRPARRGRYTLTVSAVDLAGNRAEPSERPLRILRKRRR